MKIGILTFHCAHNYGAVLQCYATQEFLRSKGYDVEVINYRPQFLLDPYKLFDRRRVISKNLMLSLKFLIVECLLFLNRYKRFRGFEKFIHNRLQIGNAVSRDSLPSDCDAYIIGSDQVWNSRITRGFDPIYFADFPFEKGNKKFISYAASMESKTLTLEQVDFYAKSIKNFDFLSVREIQLQQLLQPLTSKKISQVLDPTLMVPTHLWDNLSSDKSNVGKYVVVYQVRVNPNTMRIAEYIANQIGAKVKVLVAWLQYKAVEGTDQTATPEDFLDAIRNAACVVTTSFHGTAFAVIFNRPFYTIRLNDGSDSRSESLLGTLNLEERVVEVNASPIFSDIDYSLVNQKLEQLRSESQEYLLNSL